MAVVVRTKALVTGFLLMSRAISPANSHMLLYTILYGKETYEEVRVKTRFFFSKREEFFLKFLCVA